MSETTNHLQAILNAGAAIGNIRTIEGTPFVVVPDDYSVENLEKMLSKPMRKTGTVTLNDMASFIEFVNGEKVGGTRLYGSFTNPGFLAVFNDHHSEGVQTPGWRDYKASYACPLSIEWSTWKASSGKQLSQEQFAQFIEDNLPDVANPPAADMLEISRSLEAKKKVNFASGIRLSNGQNELTYEEQISGTAAKGKLQVPELFTIGIPVLEGGIRYAIEARLRYRIADGGRLTMWYELVRPHKILEDAVQAVWKEIEDKTSLKVFNGKP